MYFEIIVIILTLFLFLLMFIEGKKYTFEPFENPFIIRQTDPLKTYEENSYNYQYLDILRIDEINNPPLVENDVLENEETIGDYLEINNISHHFYDDSICKDLQSDNTSRFSITRELSCGEMDDFLLIVKKANNDNLLYNFPLDNKLLSELEANKWNEKQILNNVDYKKKEIENSFNNINQPKKYINGSSKLNFINIAVNRFVDLMNKEFENSSYYKKYNKHHVFEGYKLQNYYFKNYYSSKTTLNKLLERTLVVFKIHRTYKINDFIILLDIFYKPNEEATEKQTRLNNFEDNYHIYYKNAFVIGNPIRHRSSYLESDDTDFVISNFTIINEEMYQLLHLISKMRNNSSNSSSSSSSSSNIITNIEDSFKKIFDDIEQVNQNKSFNNITYKQLLFRLKKIIENYEKLNNFTKSDKIIKYEELVVKFINNAETVLQNQNIKNTDLNTNIKFKKSNLEGDSIFITKDIIKEQNKLEKKNMKSFNEIMYEKFNERNEKYKCFNPKSEDEILDKYNTRMSCISYKPNLKINGIWDKYCEKDDECPFFQSNKNYPNDFGGCIEGKCEMPIGLSVIGGTKVSNIGKPYCYNCGKFNNNNDKSYDTYQKAGRCCGPQFKSKNLNSPDFMFANDKKLRYKHRSYLEDKGLKP